MKTAETKTEMDLPLIAQHYRLGFTRIEAACLLGISKTSIDRLVRRRLLRPSLALRRPIFSVTELQRFLADTSLPH